MRLIDADALKAVFRKEYKVSFTDAIDEVIDAQPAVEERKNGKWIRITQGATPEKYICPFCHRTVEHEGVEFFVSMMYPFCHCGAKMGGEEHEADRR